MRLNLQSGVFTGILGLFGAGALVIWPDDELIGYGLFAAASLLLVWGVRINGKPWWRDIGRRFPERHKEVLHALSGPLATVQEQALTYATRDNERMIAAKATAEALVSEIPYDPITADAVRTFIQACYIAAQTHDTADEFREARENVARMAPYLFQCLHNGKGIDRRRVNWPDWWVPMNGKTRKPTSEPVSEPKPPPMEAGYRQEISSVIPSSPKPNDFSRTWNQIVAEEAGQTPRMPFSEVVRRVAYASDWADEFEGYDYDHLVRHFGDPWKMLLREVCRPLTIGDVQTWGIKQERNKEPENGPTPIAANFWTRAYFAPELMLIEQSIGSAGNSELGLIFTDIMFDRAGVRRTWPFAQRDGKPSPFEKIYAEWRAKWDEEHRQHAAWINGQSAGEVDKRAAIIASGRDLVQRYRDEDMPEPFFIFLDTERAYLDIKPHLGDEYWKARLKRERPDTRERRNLDSSDFERELARLERHWSV